MLDERETSQGKVGTHSRFCVWSNTEYHQNIVVISPIVCTLPGIRVFSTRRHKEDKDPEFLIHEAEFSIFIAREARIYYHVYLACGFRVVFNCITYTS